MDLKEVEIKAYEARRDIIEMINASGSGHPGGSLSCIDVLTCLYFAGVLNYDAVEPKREDRDRFLLCKGHAAPALYATLGNAGFFDKSAFKTFRQFGSILQGHPDMHFVPGVECSTGSLGQGLSICDGMALGLKKQGNNKSCVFAILGDGECEEGQVWEALMFAAHKKLDNLIAILDNNGLQIDGNIADVAGPGPFKEKFEAFGFDVVEIDGHNYAQIIDTLNALKNKREGKPHMVIAHTHKGRGVSFMEDVAGWHGKAPNDEETKLAVDEINAHIEEVKNA